MTTLKQILASSVLENPLFIEEFKRCAKRWLQQEPLKLNYLTVKETEMPDEMVNLQIVLGLQSCDTKGDVSNLLNDVRVCERLKLLKELGI